VFGYHWLNASANSVIRDAELTSAIEQYQFIAVVPENLMNGSTKAYQFDWPFVETPAAPKELTFFEDLLACVGQQFSVDLARVHVFGASAGGLWTTYLSTTPQVARVASVFTISGGRSPTSSPRSSCGAARPTGSG
jgi:poly(3-hydroxybutyrate) depolymerase